MKLTTPKQQGRARRHFKSPYAGPLNRQREKDIRVAERIVVEKVLHSGAEVVGIYCPSLNRNCDANLMLFITFAAQRNEIKTLGHSELKQRPEYCRERRGSVKKRPEHAH